MFLCAAMVGYPKRLEDLRRIEAAVRVTCLGCRRKRDLDREELIRELRRRHRSTAWERLDRYFRCSACGSRGVKVGGVAFADRGEAAAAVIDDALDILREARLSGVPTPISTPSVRVALAYLERLCATGSVEQFRQQVLRGGDHGDMIGRRATLGAALNGILRTLGRETE